LPALPINEETGWRAFAICDDCGIKGPWFGQPETADNYSGCGYGSSLAEIYSKIVVCGRIGIVDRSAFLCLPCAKKRRGTNGYSQ
jgi:hypothetical protein